MSKIVLSIMSEAKGPELPIEHEALGKRFYTRVRERINSYLPNPEELSSLERYRTGREKEVKRKTKASTRRIEAYHDHSESSMVGIEDWEKRKAPARPRVKRKKKKKKEERKLLGPPPRLLDLSATEKESTVECFRAWKSFWKDEKKVERYEEDESIYLMTRQLMGDLDLSGRVLDFGCGALSSFLRARRGDDEVVAADLSSEALRCSKNSFEAKHVCCFSPYTPFRENTFDTIFSGATLHNLSRIAKAPTLIELDRLLKKGGELVVLEPGAKEEDVEEVRQYLESMGYKTSLDRKKINWKEGNPSYFLILRTRKEIEENRENSFNRWLVKSKIKDLLPFESGKDYVVAKELANQVGASLDELVEEMRNEEKLDLLNPPEFPQEKPSYEKIRERLLEEEIGRLEKNKREIVTRVKREANSLSPAYGKPLFGLLMRGFGKGKLTHEDVEELSSEYELDRKDIDKMNRKLFGRLVRIPSREGEETEFGMDELARVVEVPKEELRRKIYTKWKDLEYIFKSLEKGSIKLARELYQKKISEYKRRKREWEELHRLKV